MKRQKILRIGAIAALLLALASFPLSAYLRAKRAVDSYRRQLERAGEKFTVAELLPSPIPSDQNGTVVFRQASAQLQIPDKMLDDNSPVAMQMTPSGKAIVGWRQPELRGNSTNNSWVEVDASIDRLRHSLELLEQLVEKPGLDFQLDYSQTFSLLLPHLPVLRQSVLRLSAAATAALHHGDVASAVGYQRAMLALARGMETEPLVISQLVRLGMLQIAFASQWALLQSGDLTDPDLARLQEDWMRLGSLEPVEKAFLFQRALSLETIDRMRRSNAEFRRFTSLGWSSTAPSPKSGNIFDRMLDGSKEALQTTGVRAMETLWQTAWSYPDELRTLKGQQVLLDSVRRIRAGQPFNTALRIQTGELTRLGFKKPDKDSYSFGPNAAEPDLRSLFSDSLLSLQRVLPRVLRAEVARQLVLTSIALQRYHFRHSSYPPALAGLVPEFLASAPADPADGQPLRYRVTGDGAFVLYSVGDNGRDDGGNGSMQTASQTPQWHNGLDLVWPPEATPEETAAWYLRKAGIAAW